MTVAVWLVFSWPLPQHISDGIPMSSTNIEKDSMRYMIPGDHLQLHYFYWLFNDMLHGNTPLYHNLYEFNLGDDAARYRIGNYNVPFSFIYAFWALFGNSSFAWNMMGITLIWLTGWLTWILARRFTNDDRIAALAALVSITLPYRWMNLFGGSPMGMAMTWVPLLYLGVDMAIRDRSLKGGLIAGLTLIGIFYTDTHIFFFAGLFMPLWGIVALLRSDLSSLKQRKTWLKISLAMLPILIAAMLMLARGMAVKQSHIGTSTVSDGRSTSVVAIFTATPAGLIQWQACGKQAHIYLGWTIPILITIGLIAATIFFAITTFKNRKSNLSSDNSEKQTKTASTIKLTVLILFALHATAIIILAVGSYGPFEGRLFALFRDHIPGYSMMRQPGKIFSLLPTILALTLTALFTITKTYRRFSQRILTAIIAVAAAAIFIEYACQVRITICLLDREQPAYAAIRADADKTDGEARAMIIPFWPGDSAWASIYQYYVSLYHIKMINGYSPIVPKSYVEEIYELLGRSNIGVLPDFLLDNLLQRNIRYILLHENAFPEQVSPFPVGFTLKRLLNHPRLTLLKHAEHIWSFRIEKEPTEKAETLTEWKTFFPTMEWEFENGGTAGSPERLHETTASGGTSLMLENPGQCVTSRIFRAWIAPQSRLSIRARGNGTLQTQLTATNTAAETTAIKSTDWKWYDVSMKALPERTLCQPVISLTNGKVELDVMQYLAGEWHTMNPGEELTLPAALFFHAGHITDNYSSVKIRRNCEPDDYIFYGPNLPLPTGRYQIQMDYTSDAEPGTKLGTVSALARQIESSPADVIAGSPAILEFEQTLNLPLRFNFKFTRNADLTIHKITIKHL